MIVQIECCNRKSNQHCQRIRFLQGCSYKMETQHSQKWSPRMFRSKTLGLGKSIFYLVGCLFPDQLESVFNCLVGNLLEVVASVRLGFHFIGVAGGLVSGQ